MNKFTLFYLQNYQIFSTFTAIKSFCDPVRSFYRPNWQISLPSTSTSEIPTLTYTWRMKKGTLSGGASPYRPSERVLPPLPPPSSPIHCFIGFFTKYLPLRVLIFNVFNLNRHWSVTIYIYTKLEYIHIFNLETQSRMKQFKSNTTIKRWTHHWVKRVKFAVIFNERGVPYILFYSIGL